MARLITKFKYLKPDERNHFGGYAEYIATREGVEKIDECWPAIPTIATDLKLSLSTVRRGIRDLKKSGAPRNRAAIPQEGRQKQSAVPTQKGIKKDRLSAVSV